MSNKRGMSKRQRLYYEHQNKDKLREELIEYAKQVREVEKYKEYINLSKNYWN